MSNMVYDAINYFQYWTIRTQWIANYVFEDTFSDFQATQMGGYVQIWFIMNNLLNNRGQ